MTTAALPRSARQLPPEDRDMRIFQLAEIHGWTHETIAREVDLTRRRVSQIVEEVRAWLARHPADAPELKAEEERRMYERNLERMRLSDIMLRAVQGLDRAPAALTTIRTTENGGEVRTTREQPPVDVRLLRMYQRAVTALGNLDREPLPPAPPAPPLAEEPWMHQKIQEVVARWQLKSHGYVVSDSCFAKFAADLTTAFLECAEDLMVARREAEAAAGGEAAGTAKEDGVGRPAPNDEAAESGAGVSQISLPEGNLEQEVMTASDVSTVDADMTSVVQFARKAEPAERKTAAENLEKGNEKGNAVQYSKPLFIGPLPEDHPAMQPIRPLPIRRVDQAAVAQVRITPQDPGAEFSESGERLQFEETTARQSRNQSVNRESSESHESGRNH